MARSRFIKVSTEGKNRLISSLFFSPHPLNNEIFRSGGEGVNFRRQNSINPRSTNSLGKVAGKQQPPLTT